MGRTGAPDRRARTASPTPVQAGRPKEIDKDPLPGGHILITQDPDRVVLLEQFHDPFTGAPFRDHHIAVDRPHMFDHVIEDGTVQGPIDDMQRG